MRHGCGYPQPFIRILEQPLERGFRFRYKSEAGAHGGLPAESSSRNSKKYPTIKIENYIGPARIEVTLMTNESEPRLHVHKLVGKNCEDGVCHVRLNPDNGMVLSFQNLGVLHVPKKEVAQIMQERLEEEYRIQRMMNNDSDSDNYELTEVEKQMLKQNAEESAKSMELNVVRLCFQGYIIDAGGNEIPIPPVLSNPVFDSKSPNTAALKICRMDKQAGFCVGNEEIFLLCERVQKDDVSVRFFELDESGKEIWHDYGKFSIHDVHKQYAIVFRTPAFRFQNITKPAKVFIQLQKKKDGLTSEPKPFTFKPLPCYEEVGRKRQKGILNLADVEILNDAMTMINKSSSDSSIRTTNPPSVINSQRDKERCNNVISKSDHPEVSHRHGERPMPHYRHEKIYPETMSYDKSFAMGDLDHQNRAYKFYPITINDEIPQRDHQKQSLQYGSSREKNNLNNININYHHYQQQHFYHPSCITGPPLPSNHGIQQPPPSSSHLHEHSENDVIQEHPIIYNSRGRSARNISGNDEIHVGERVHTKYYSDVDIQSSPAMDGVEHDEVKHKKTNSVEKSNERAFNESSPMTANNYRMSQGELYHSGGVSSGGDNDSSTRCNSYISDGGSRHSTPPSFIKYYNPSVTGLVSGQRRYSQDDDNNNPSHLLDGYDVLNQSGEPKEDYDNSPRSYDNDVGVQRFVSRSPNNISYFVSDGQNKYWSRHYDHSESIEPEGISDGSSRMLQMSQIDLDRQFYQQQPAGNVENAIRHNTHPYNLNQYEQAMEESKQRSQDLVPMLIARGHAKKPIETRQVKTIGKVYPMPNMNNDKASSTLEIIGEELKTLKINGSEPSTLSYGVTSNKQNSPLKDNSISIDRHKTLVKGSQIQLALNEYAALNDPLPLLTIFSDFICLPDEEGNTPLHYALISKNEQVAVLFLQSIMQNKSLCQGLLECYNNEQKVPLHIALENRLHKCTRLLLSLGTDVSLINARGNNPLHLCLIYSLDEILKYLTTRTYKRTKVILNEMNYAGLSPIHIAASRQSNKYLKMLNLPDIDVNVKEGKSGRAPIHIAIQKDLIQNVIYLIEKMNADTNIVSYDGLKPLDMIKDDLQSSPLLKDILIKYGAEKGKDKSILEIESDSDSIECD